MSEPEPETDDSWPAGLPEALRVKPVANEHDTDRLCLGPACALFGSVYQWQCTRAYCPRCGAFGWGYVDTVALHAGAVFYARYTGSTHDDVVTALGDYHRDWTALFWDLMHTGRVAADEPYDVQLLVFEQIANDLDPLAALAAARAVLE